MNGRQMLIKIVFCFAGSIFLQNLFGQTVENKTNQSFSEKVQLKNSIAIRPIDLFLSIYTIQYERQINVHDEFIFGLYYIGNNTNTSYPGTFQLYSPMIGYRRYLWKGLHVEDLLLPGLARYYNTKLLLKDISFEIWNEIHFGYRFELRLSGISLFITPQALFGFNLYRGNQPLSFKEIDDKPENFIPNKLYIFPNVDIGFRF
jgi:hypothetical protein